MGAIIAAWRIGYLAYWHPNPLPVLNNDLRRLFVTAVVVGGVVLAWMLLPPIVDGVVERVAPTDVDGLAKLTLFGFVFIAWMLYALGRAIDQLNRRLDELVPHQRPSWDDEDD